MCLLVKLSGPDDFIRKDVAVGEFHGVIEGLAGGKHKLPLHSSLFNLLLQYLLKESFLLLLLLQLHLPEKNRKSSFF